MTEELFREDSYLRQCDATVVAVDDGAIVVVGRFDDVRAEHPDASVLGDADALVTPGYVNAHQHLTGDRLVRSCIPEDIDSQSSIFDWAVPVHAHHTGDDDELTATLGAVEAVLNGVTTTIEAGTVLRQPCTHLAKFFILVFVLQQLDDAVTNQQH